MIANNMNYYYTTVCFKKMDYFSIMTIVMHIKTAVKESRVFRINPRLTYPPQCPTSTSLADYFAATNAGNK